MNNSDALQARRYLLGQSSDQESAVLEQEYLEHDEAVERIAAVEDDLIEDYLTGQLSADDRERFERSYLASAPHRVRVETVRRLMANASQQSAAGAVPMTRGVAAKRIAPYRQWLALAASLLLVVSVARWYFSTNGTLQVAPTQNPAPQTPAAVAEAPRVFAEALSPVGVRGASESRSIVIPAGTETLVLRLESEGDGRQLTARRAAIRTVGGQDVWQGTVTPDSNLPTGIVARIDVPAGRLPPDDYLVTLLGTDRAGAEVEWSQYFLRVRAR